MGRSQDLRLVAGQRGVPAVVVVGRGRREPPKPPEYPEAPAAGAVEVEVEELSAEPRQAPRARPAASPGAPAPRLADAERARGAPQAEEDPLVVPGSARGVRGLFALPALNGRPRASSTPRGPPDCSGSAPAASGTARPPDRRASAGRASAGAPVDRARLWSP